MALNTVRIWSIAFAVAASPMVCSGCGDDDPSQPGFASGGSPVATGGMTASGGGSGLTTGTGGETSSGGTTSSGGMTSTGGTGPGPSANVDVVAATEEGGFIQSFDTAPVVLGPWYSFEWENSGCPIDPADGDAVPVTASGICLSVNGECTGTADYKGAAMGFKVCTMPGEVSAEWTEMQAFLDANGFAVDSVHSFAECNPGKVITSLTLSAALPAGSVVQFNDVTDETLAEVPATGTEVALPSTVDGGAVAAINLTIKQPEANVSFCQTSVLINYQ